MELSFSYTPGEGAPWALIELLVRADNALTTQLLLPSVAAESAVPQLGQSAVLVGPLWPSCDWLDLSWFLAALRTRAMHSKRVARPPRPSGRLWCSP